MKHGMYGEVFNTHEVHLAIESRTLRQEGVELHNDMILQEP